MKIVLQEWEESERGWGVRPDGYSAHVDINSMHAFIADYNSTLPNDHVPDEYSRPCGDPINLNIASDSIKKELISRGLLEKGSIWLLNNEPITRSIVQAIRKKEFNVP